MTTSELAALIGKPIRILDKRTGASYSDMVTDAKTAFGSLRLQVNASTWFEPTHAELLTVTQENPN